MLLNKTLITFKIETLFPETDADSGMTQQIVAAESKLDFVMLRERPYCPVTKVILLLEIAMN